MAFLFRKYTQNAPDDEVSQEEAEIVESEPVPKPEFKLFPPSPKAQLVLIAAGFFLFNCLLIGIWAVVLYYNRG